MLDREYNEGRKVPLQELHKECEGFLSLKRDRDNIAGNVKVVEETRKVEKKPVVWWNSRRAS